MSRIDPSILGGLRKIPTPLEMAQQESLIADRQAQVQERQMQAAQLRAKFDADRDKYNSEAAIKALLQNKPDADINEVMSVGGAAGIPFVKELLAQRKEEADQRAAAITAHGKVIDEVGNIALGLKSLPIDKRPQAMQMAVQRAMQSGIFDQNTANELLGSHDTDEELDQFIATTPAYKTQLKQQQDAAAAASKKAADDALLLERQSTTKKNETEIQKTQMEMAGTLPQKSATAAQIPGRDVPFPPDVEAQRKRMQQDRQGTATGADVEDTVNGIIEGRINPNMSQSVSYRDRTAVSAGLARKGYDQAAAQRDWTAVQRNLGTLNGAQQTRLRQAVNFAADSLPQLEDAYAEWKKQAGISGFKVLNRASLRAMENLPGAPGSAATQLEALIKDYTSELGTVYKGGNSSTDESLKLAGENLKAEWNEQTFQDAIKRIRQSIYIRRNSINNVQAVGVSPNSPYQPPIAAPQEAAPIEEWERVNGKLQKKKK